jgi:hypothetical protein
MTNKRKQRKWLLSCGREVPISNRDQTPTAINDDFCGSSSTPNYATTSSFQILSNSLFTYYSITLSYAE